MAEEAFKEDFHRIVAGDNVIVARLTGAGPYLRSESAPGEHVVLGNETRVRLVTTDVQGRPLPRPAWAICKYRTPRIMLHDILPTEAERVAMEFGLNFRPSLQSDFYASPAFESLTRWVSENPRAARHMAEEPIAFTYVGDWLSRAEDAAMNTDVDATEEGPQRLGM